MTPSGALHRRQSSRCALGVQEPLGEVESVVGDALNAETVEQSLGPFAVLGAKQIDRAESSEGGPGLGVEVRHDAREVPLVQIVEGEAALGQKFSQLDVVALLCS